MYILALWLSPVHGLFLAANRSRSEAAGKAKYTAIYIA